MNKMIKKFFTVIFAGLFLFLLAACNSESSLSGYHSVTMEVEGQSLTVIFDENTFSSGKIQAENGEYVFQYEALSNGVRFTVTYPDGYVYSQKKEGGAYGMSPDYDVNEREEKGYIGGISLEWLVESAANNVKGKQKGSGPSRLLGILLIGCGAWNFFAPKTVWWFARGWWYKDAEPSGAALTFYGVLGILLMFAGIICLLASL